MEMGLILIPVIVIFLIMLIIAIFQWLWNITMPQVFDLKEISFWLAFRLLLIAVFLTSGSFIKFNFGW